MQPPAFSVDWYLSVVEFAQDTPGWLHAVADVGTDAGLLAYAVLFLFGWWAARTRSAETMATALLAPGAVIGAYLVSDTAKSLFQQERPCNAMDHVITVATCQEADSWAFPSNHATIVAAAAAAVMFVLPRAAAPALALAALMSLSRVFVGVHYPHDIAVGFVIGLITAPLFISATVPLATPLVERLRGRRFSDLMLGPGPVDQPANPVGARLR